MLWIDALHASVVRKKSNMPLSQCKRILKVSTKHQAGKSLAVKTQGLPLMMIELSFAAHLFSHFSL